MRKAIRTCALAVGVLLTAAATVVPAVAQPKAPPGGGTDQVTADLMRRQAPLVEAAGKILDAVDEEKSGYAGLVVSAETDRVTLYWHGTVPPEVRDLVDGLTGAGTKVVVTAAPYPFGTLMAEANRLIEKAGVVAVAPQPDGTGLLVRTEHAGMAPLNSSVPIASSVGARPQPATRWADSPDWWGGAVFENADTGHICTSGFAVRRGDGRRMMMTAGHCGQNGSVWWTLRTQAAAERFIGVATMENDEFEALVIDAPSQGRSYDGGTDPTGFGSGEFSKPVAGWSNALNGIFVCHSGAFSGARCGIRITNANFLYQLEDPPGRFTVVRNGVEAEKTDRTNAWGNGDSGGPVFTLSADSSQVFITGVVSAMDVPAAEVPCTGIVVTGRRCAWRVYFASFIRQAQVMGLDVVRG